MNADSAAGSALRPRTLVLGLGVLLAVAGATAGAQEWTPDKPVELIATNAPGGGSDRIGRILIKILQERRYLPVPMNLVNKPGGGGSVAYNYTNQHPGNGHFLADTRGQMMLVLCRPVSAWDRRQREAGIPY